MENTDFLPITKLQKETLSELKSIGVAADHGGFELKDYLVKQ